MCVCVLTNLRASLNEHSWPKQHAWLRLKESSEILLYCVYQKIAPCILWAGFCVAAQRTYSITNSTLTPSIYLLVQIQSTCTHKHSGMPQSSLDCVLLITQHYSFHFTHINCCYNIHYMYTLQLDNFECATETISHNSQPLFYSMFFSYSYTYWHEHLKVPHHADFTFARPLWQPDNISRIKKNTSNSKNNFRTSHLQDGMIVISHLNIVLVFLHQVQYTTTLSYTTLSHSTESELTLRSVLQSAHGFSFLKAADQLMPVYQDKQGQCWNKIILLSTQIQDNFFPQFSYIYYFILIIYTVTCEL